MEGGLLGGLVPLLALPTGRTARAVSVEGHALTRHGNCLHPSLHVHQHFPDENICFV